MIFLSKDQKLCVRIGAQKGRILNMFINFNGPRFADILSSLEYVDVLRSQEISEETYGLVLKIRKGAMSQLIEEIPNCMYQYESRGCME